MSCFEHIQMSHCVRKNGISCYWSEYGTFKNKISAGSKNSYYCSGTFYS